MATGKMTSHVLITTSVPMESVGIKHELGTFKTIRTGGRTVFSGSIENRAIRLIETGPGLVNTAQSLSAAIETCAPDLILMTGCAGGFGRAGMGIGDIAIASEENDAQLGIEPETAEAPLMPLPFDLGNIDGVGIKHRIPMDSNMVSTALDSIKTAFSDIRINIQTGPFITVSTITATNNNADRLYNRFQPCMENMEGFAGAYIAKHYGVPFLEIRCASNLVGKRDRASWDLQIACERSAKAAIAFLLQEG